MVIKSLIKGILTFIPGINSLLPKGKTGGTDTAQYCYEVWLKHLTLSVNNGMNTMPNTIAELGPGDSVGIGLAAMLSGVNNYYALDVVRFSDTTNNLKVFDELVNLFKMRAAARLKRGWPDIDMYLDEHYFPSSILTEELLEQSLSDERVQRIRNALVNSGSQDEGVSIKYYVPWTNNNILEKESVDLIISHSVLEHVVDLENTYEAMSLWLKPNGMMSHQIDFQSHGLTEKWNGFRAFSEMFWKILVGKRPWFINRQPCSVHMELINKYGFEVICHLKNYREDGIQRSQLSSQWKDISDDDLLCSGTYILAQKPEKI